MGHVSDRPTTLRVATVTLDELVAETGRSPSVVKMDVEGGEVEALRGASRLLREGRPTWFIALHGDAARRGCAGILSAAGYELRTLAGEPIADLATWGGDELVAAPAG